MIIPKVARDSAPYERLFLGFPSARLALRAFLRDTRAAELGGVLLPAYVGWSPREGSGVFDPVRELDVPRSFYRVTCKLEIDVADLREKLDRLRPRVLLVIHYFGFPDPSYELVVDIARERGVMVLEDEAHAMLTDLVMGTTGRLGDASIVSLHKLLPMDSGGGLLINPRSREAFADLVGNDTIMNPWQYDLTALAKHRCRNAELIQELIQPLRGRVDPLWQLSQGVVPQTYPVLVHTPSRDLVYERMNAAGFGVVSLYHTLIDEISREDFPDSFDLSRTIMNLPVHQEATEVTLTAMIEELTNITS